VKFKELADLWQEICDLSSSTEMRVSHNFEPTDNFLANLSNQVNLAPQVNQAYQAFLTKEVFDRVRDDDTSEQMDIFRKAMVRHSPNRAMPYLNDNVFWTNLASPYVWYAPV
jgi:plasmid maintenance system antidote protein VapI